MKHSWELLQNKGIMKASGYSIKLSGLKLCPDASIVYDALDGWELELTHTSEVQICIQFHLKLSH